MAASGTDNIPDAQQLVPDRVQFGGIFDFKFDGKDTLAAGQILAEKLLDPNPGSGHGGGHVQQQAVAGDAVQLQSSFAQRTRTQRAA